MSVISDKPPLGCHGLHDITIEGAEVGFKKDCDAWAIFEKLSLTSSTPQVPRS
jgi:hypothetical protein